MSRSDNSRRSQWRVLDRCMTMLRLLLRGPAQADSLLQVIIDDAADDEQPITKGEASRRFEEDRSRLRQHFGCDITYVRGDDVYQLNSIDKPIIDLSDEAIRGLAFLRATFHPTHAPDRDTVLALVDEVTRLLPAARQQEALRESGFTELRLGIRDQDVIREDVREAVQRACDERRRLEILYLSPNRPDGLSVRHLLEPYRLYFDTKGGHYFLEAFSLESESATYGRRLQERLMRFRLGRIQEAYVQEKHFVPRRIPKKELVYRLSPEVARGGVSQQFEGSQIVLNEDGSATIRALSSNLFGDLRELLRYGAECEVLGGDEARDEMRRLVRAMGEIYGE